MEKINRDFNGVAKFLLGLSMFATTMTIINSFLQISNMKMFGYVASDTLAIEIVLDFLILGAAVLTFLKKPAGLIALTALFIIRMFATIPWNGDTSAAYMLGGKTADLIRDFGFFAIAMCFKKNGISGWKSMLASEKYVDEHTIIPSKEEIKSESTENTDEESIYQENAQPSSADLLASENISDVIRPYEETNEPEPIQERVVQSRVANQVNKEKNHARKEHKKTIKEQFGSLNKYKRAGILSTIAIILLFAIMTLVVIFKSYPNYVSSFGDKWKYTFNLPNDQLVQHLMNEIHGKDTTGYFVVEFSDGDVIGYTKEYYFDNRIDLHREWHPVRIHSTIKQVTSPSDILVDQTYARPDSVYYRWEIMDNKGLEAFKEAWESNSKQSGDWAKTIVYELKPYNYEEGLKKEMSIADIAASIPVRSIEVADQVGGYYLLEENYSKASDYYRFLLKKYPRNAAIKGRLAYTLTRGGDFEEARIIAEEALEKDPKEIQALSALALIEAENYNWGEVKKWGKKAIDYGSVSSTVYYAYAMALFKQGEKKAANEYYNKAFEQYRLNPLRSKYEECAGCPFEIVSFHYGFTNYNGDVISPYDSKLLSSKSRYISTRLDVNFLRYDGAQIKVKLLQDGKLSTGTGSKDGYSYTQSVWPQFQKTGKQTVSAGSWGSDTPGHWRAGNYEIQIWYKDEMIGSDTFRIF